MLGHKVILCIFLTYFNKDFSIPLVFRRLLFFCVFGVFSGDVGF